MPAWCSPTWTGAKDAWWQYWRVEPTTEWRVVEPLSCRLSPSWEKHDVDLEAGTVLELIAIWPCTDSTGTCVWQTACSAHMFRVTTGSHAGATVELSGFANQLTPAVRPLDPKATVSFTVPAERR
jgi:hypothetical protein